jgi:2'-5' RNA ligase
MAVAIICHPEFSAADRNWIEAVRSRHDPQAAMVAAHVTLVFPAEELDEVAIVAHAQSTAAVTAPITFQLTAAHPVRDKISSQSHIFLTPDLGETEIRDLHAALYSGVLASQLRTDIPFVPHITVGAAQTLEAAETVAASLGPIAISGRLTTLDLVGFDGRTVTPLADFPLLG